MSKEQRIENTEGVKNDNKNKTHIEKKQFTALHKNADNASTKKALTIVKIIHRLKAVTSIQKARN